MVSIAALHRLNAGLWLRQASQVLIYRQDPVKGWGLIGKFRAIVQSANSSNSSPDERMANGNEVYSVVVYLDPGAPIEVGDRIHWDGDDWQVNNGDWRRTDRGYRRIVCSVVQTGVIRELISFSSVLHDNDGLPIGEIDLGEFKCQFIETTDAPTAKPPVLGGTGFANAPTSGGRILIDLEEAPVGVSELVPGVGFVRNGVPGRVVSRSEAMPGVIVLFYEMEGRTV